MHFAQVLACGERIHKICKIVNRLFGERANANVSVENIVEPCVGFAEVILWFSSVCIYQLVEFLGPVMTDTCLKLLFAIFFLLSFPKNSPLRPFTCLALNSMPSCVAFLPVNYAVMWLVLYVYGDACGKAGYDVVIR